jgi:hypothetical protein
MHEHTAAACSGLLYKLAGRRPETDHILASIVGGEEVQVFEA